MLADWHRTHPTFNSKYPRRPSSDNDEPCERRSGLTLPRRERPRRRERATSVQVLTL